jgi:hypothetical protein
MAFTGATRPLWQFPDNADNAFKKAQTPTSGRKVQEPQVSNASLDGETIRRLVEGVFGKDPHISFSSFDMTELYFQVTYGIDKTAKTAKTAKSDGENTLFLDITQCATSAEAMRKMKNHLDGFQGRLEKLVRRPKVELGSHALQSCTSVFWIRDTVFINVSGDGMSAPSGAYPLPIIKKLPL